ncbi:MAG: sulfatase-like hydrolase/transferase [Lachnospiraceae bacterium]
MKKNVIVILCDQLRKDYMPCYGGTNVSTPHIDTLVRDGVLLTNTISASPVCAPARASMMTGRYISDHAVWTNDLPFREGLEYLPQRINENGYRTGTFGKLHHYPGKDTKGFQTGLQMEENRLFEEDDYFQWLKERHPEIKNLFPNDAKGNFPYGENEYYEHWIADNTIQFIEESLESEMPFFSWTSFQGPHGPLDPPLDCEYTVDKSLIPDPEHTDFRSTCDIPQYRKYTKMDKITQEKMREYRFNYLKLIEVIDRQIGRIITYLKEHELYENTVILFTTDHGDMCGELGMLHKGPFSYRGQFEVPFILTNCDALVNPPTESDILVNNLDIGATVLDIMGDKKPFGNSRSVVEMLNDPTKERTSNFAEFTDAVKFIDTKQYRFAYYPFSQQCELFDKTLPDYELHNLVNDEKYLPIKAKFLAEIIDYLLVAKGVTIEAIDLVPSLQKGLAEKLPNYQDVIPLITPISNQRDRDTLVEYGLDGDYNEFCRGRKIRRHYGVYWDASIAHVHED